MTEKISKENSGEGNAGRVLYVDGDIDVAGVIMELLRGVCCAEVDFAASMGDAKKALRLKLYTLIVTAYYLKGSTGLDFLKQLKSEGNEVPVVMFSIQDGDTASEALRLGALKFIEAYGNSEQIFANLIETIKQVCRK